MAGESSDMNDIFGKYGSSGKQEDNKEKSDFVRQIEERAKDKEKKRESSGSVDPFDDMDWLGEIEQVEKKWHGATSDIPVVVTEEKVSDSSSDSEAEDEVSPEKKMRHNSGEGVRGGNGVEEKDSVESTKQGLVPDTMDFSVIQKSTTLDTGLLRSRARLSKIGSLRDRKKPSRPSSLLFANASSNEVAAGQLPESVFRDSTEPKLLSITKIDEDDEEKRDEEKVVEEKKPEPMGRTKKPPPGAAPSPFLLPGMGGGFPIKLKKVNQSKTPPPKPADKPKDRKSLEKDKGKPLTPISSPAHTPQPVIIPVHKPPTIVKRESPKRSEPTPPPRPLKPIKKTPVSTQSKKDVVPVTETDSKMLSKKESEKVVLPPVQPDKIVLPSLDDAKEIKSNKESEKPTLKDTVVVTPKEDVVQPQETKKKEIVEKPDAFDFVALELKSKVKETKIESKDDKPLKDDKKENEKVELKEEERVKEDAKIVHDAEKVNVDVKITKELEKDVTKAEKELEEKEQLKDSVVSPVSLEDEKVKDEGAETEKESSEIGKMKSVADDDDDDDVFEDWVKVSKDEAVVEDKEDKNIDASLISLDDNKEKAEEESKEKAEEKVQEKEEEEPGKDHEPEKEKRTKTKQPEKTKEQEKTKQPEKTKEREKTKEPEPETESVSQKNVKSDVTRLRKTSENKDELDKLAKYEQSSEAQKHKEFLGKREEPELNILNNDTHEKFTNEEKTKEVLIIDKSSTSSPGSSNVKSNSRHSVDNKKPGDTIILDKKPLKQEAWVREAKKVPEGSTLKPLEKIESTSSVRNTDNMKSPRSQGSKTSSLDVRDEDIKNENDKSPRNNKENSEMSPAWSKEPKTKKKLPPLPPPKPKMSPKETPPSSVPQWKRDLAKKKQDAENRRKSTPLVVPPPPKKDASVPLMTTLPQWQIELAAKKAAAKESSLDKFLGEEKSKDHVDEPPWKIEAAKRRKQRQSVGDAGQSPSPAKEVEQHSDSNIPQWKKELLQRRRKSDILKESPPLSLPKDNTDSKSTNVKPEWKSKSLKLKSRYSSDSNQSPLSSPRDTSNPTTPDWKKQIQANRSRRRSDLERIVGHDAAADLV